MNIGELLKALRKGAGLTQKELGALLGTTPQNIAQYESGKRNPKSETLQKIFDVLYTCYTCLKKQNDELLERSDQLLKYADKNTNRYDELLKQTTEFKKVSDEFEKNIEFLKYIQEMPWYSKNLPNDFEKVRPSGSLSKLYDTSGSTRDEVSADRIAEKEADSVLYESPYDCLDVSQCIQNACCKLNRTGLEKVADYAETIAKIPDYQRNKEDYGKKESE